MDNRQGWRYAGFSFVILLGLFLGAYHPTVNAIIAAWNEIDIGEYGHGYLVLLISLYLIWQKRKLLGRLPPNPEYRAFIPLLLATGGWMLGALAGVQIVQEALFGIILLSLCWLVFGSRVTGHLLFPLLFLYLALPVWTFLHIPLQEITTDVVYAAVRWLDVPALREQHRIILPSGSLDIEEACSGVRYFLAALTLGTLYGYINYTKLKTRLQVVVITALCAVLANILRVFIVVYVAYVTAMQHPLVRDHQTLGWAIFGLFVIILLIIDTRLVHRNDVSTATADQEDLLDPSPPATTVSGQSYLVLTVVAVLALLLAPTLADRLTAAHAADDRIHLVLPVATGSWSGPRQVQDDWRPLFPGAQTVKAAYQRGDDSVSVFIGFYPRQQQGAELINQLNKIYNRDAWTKVNERPKSQTVSGYSMLEQKLSGRRGQQRLVWYWYWVAGHATTSPYWAKIYQVWGLLTGDSRAAIIAVATDGDTYADMVARLNEFLDQYRAQLQATVAGTPAL